MAYFANGTDGMIYQARYCDRCIHNANEDCPILTLHLIWNYEQEDSPDKKQALDTFIPTGSDGWPAECLMFMAEQK